MRGLIAVCCVLAIFEGVAAADKESARTAYKLGIQHYNLAEYRDALDAFKEAYRQFEEPALLFNIGQCHRQLGDRQQAITFFRTYLREVPEAENRDEVKRLMATLEQEQAAERASRSTPPQEQSHHLTLGDRVCRQPPLSLLRRLLNRSVAKVRSGPSWRVWWWW